MRILLAICRPDQGHDVPFRSVATRILKGLDETSRQAFDLDVLRPPTFDALAKKLRDACNAGRPYHVLHFDGHGAHLEIGKYLDGLKIDRHRFSPQEIYPRIPRSGQYGYLLFENPDNDLNQRFVDGQELSALLVETGVPVLVLNACRSAYAEAREKPEAASDAVSSEAAESRRTERALGSLAQELMDSGVGGVVAMRYNVYVVTAARFIAELYGSLARGQTLGAAVTLGRKDLHDKPLREVVFEPLPLQDWQVPIVYEASPIALFPKPDGGGKLDISLDAASIVAGGGLDPTLPPTPDAGFRGRDETLLALDRAFDDQRVVLLHAYAGSGKTATAAEFARWYAQTGGVEGDVLFTSFEHHTPLARVLDQIGDRFGPMLERSGVHWLAITDEGVRRQVALQVLEQVPVLWIWDNVEPVTGFPTGSESAWTDVEQAELVGFLRDCRDTKARFLLTSRRDEEAWLGDLPARIRVPPMPMMERLQVTRALAEKRGRRAEVMKDWRPLLEFSDGNPLALTVLVGQALRDWLVGRDAVQGFVDRLRAGEAEFDDKADEGRSRSLGASLGYGFEHAFDEEERRRLALLHLFQGSVHVVVLVTMGDPNGAWCLPEVRGLAFVEAMELGNFYSGQYRNGNREVIVALRAEEANLLQARRLARAHGWWWRVISAMQGLRTLYSHTGQRSEWRRLVEEIVPDFVDPETDGPLPGQEDKWGTVTEYRVQLAREERKWVEAERLQQVCVAWDRQRAAPILELPRTSLDNLKRNTVHSLAASLHELGEIQRELGREDCVTAYKESLALHESIGDRTGAGICAFNIGESYGESATDDIQKSHQVIEMIEQNL